MRGVVLVLVEELKKQNETLLPWLLLRHVFFFFKCSVKSEAASQLLFASK